MLLAGKMNLFPAPTLFTGCGPVMDTWATCLSEVIPQCPVEMQCSGMSFEALELSASMLADSQLFFGHGW